MPIETIHLTPIHKDISDKNVNQSPYPCHFGSILRSKLLEASPTSNRVQPSNQAWEPPNQRALNFRFSFSSDYPATLKSKLENMWKNCNTNDERETFANMYYGNFLQMKLPSGEERWDRNWNITLGYCLKYETESIFDVLPNYRDERIKEIKMLKEMCGL